MFVYQNFASAIRCDNEWRFSLYKAHLQIPLRKYHLHVKHGHTEMKNKASVLGVFEIRIVVQVIQILVGKRHTVVPTVLHGKASILLRQIQLYLVDL